jgi:hypothetical protein
MATTDTFTFGSSQHPFELSFPFIDEDNLVVTLDGVEQQLGTNYTVINKTSNTAAGVGFLSGAQIQFVDNPPTNPLPTTGAVKVVRNTTLETTSTFKTGSAIRAIDLNSNFTQNLYVTEEISNNAILTDGSNALDGDLNMGGNQITNLAGPTSDTDGVNKSYVDARFSDGAGTVPSFTRWLVTATSGQTVFSGLDSNNQTLSFQQGRESVFVNGALQSRGLDYTTDTAGTTVTFNVGLTTADVVDITCVNSLLSGVSGQASSVQYTPSGVGVVSRTVEARLRDFVSVLDFGAIRDGVTDDTVAFTAADTSNVPYFVPPGNYVLNAVLTGTKAFSFGDVTITGTGSIILNELREATTSNAGVVQLTSALNSTSETLAATANAVKLTNDAVATAQAAADAAQVPFTRTNISTTPTQPINIGEHVTVTAAGVTIPLPTGTDGDTVRISVGNFTNTIVSSLQNIMANGSDLTIDIALSTITLMYDNNDDGSGSNTVGWRII